MFNCQLQPPPPRLFPLLIPAVYAGPLFGRNEPSRRRAALCVCKYQQNTIKLDKFIQEKLYSLQVTLTSENSGSYGAEFGRNKSGGRRQPLW